MWAMNQDCEIGLWQKLLTISFVGFVFSLQKEEEAEAEVKEEVTPAEGGEEVSIFVRDCFFFFNDLENLCLSKGNLS